MYVYIISNIYNCIYICTILLILHYSFIDYIIHRKVESTISREIQLGRCLESANQLSIDRKPWTFTTYLRYDVSLANNWGMFEGSGLDPPEA